MSRSVWKPTVFSTISRNIAKSVETQQPRTNSMKSKSVSTLLFKNRASVISEQRINYSIAIYNGHSWFTAVVTPERVGHLVGEFAPTRKRAVFKQKNQAKGGKGN